MQILPFFPIPAFKDNYIWAVVNPEKKSALIVDPGDALPVIAFLESRNLALETILITHHHADHRGGLPLLREKYSPLVYAPFHPEIENPSVIVQDLSLVTTSGFGCFEVLSIPGHTLEHMAYYHPEGFVFAGDTLFSAGCGRVFEGTYPQMYDSLLRLKNLPHETELYCGHEYTLANLLFAQAVEPDNKDIKQMILEVEDKRHQNIPTLPSRLAFEKKVNPFLRCDVKAVIESAQDFENKCLVTEYEVFEVLRRWKNNF
jgi:hydroxyacylglutathione hydrolase